MKYNIFFPVWVRRNKGYGDYVVKVPRSPVGSELRADFNLDPIRITALRSKLAAKPTEKALRALGTLLFETLFTAGDVRTLLQMSLERASEDGVLLRVQLLIEPNELSALPWELLFEPDSEQFLALSDRTTLVRYLPLDSDSAALSHVVVKPPLRILGLFPSPNVVPQLDVDREREVMDAALEPLTEKGLVELVYPEHATVSDTIDTLDRNHPVHILYYQGHVGFNPKSQSSFLLLEGWKGEPFEKGVDLLSHTLHRYGVRLAVIHSEGMAAGGIAYELVGLGVPAVVATQEPLDDKETAIFLKEFCLALATKLPVEVAVTRGRRALRAVLGPRGHWASPILVIGSPDASLFSLERQL